MEGKEILFFVVLILTRLKFCFSAFEVLLSKTSSFVFRYVSKRRHFGTTVNKQHQPILFSLGKVFKNAIAVRE